MVLTHLNLQREKLLFGLISKLDLKLFLKYLNIYINFYKKRHSNVTMSFLFILLLRSFLILFHILHLMELVVILKYFHLVLR